MLDPKINIFSIHSVQWHLSCCMYSVHFYNNLEFNQLERGQKLVLCLKWGERELPLGSWIEDFLIPRCLFAGCPMSIVALRNKGENCLFDRLPVSSFWGSCAFEFVRFVIVSFLDLECCHGIVKCYQCPEYWVGAMKRDLANRLSYKSLFTLLCS